ncbi:blue-light-activated protein [Mariprofundus micogutta]|uniref:histidine kinase n=2 Tax=Mariprofundus micogutta TaxID=1921010 RepID=A0A1L8CRC9_9PROT|nr:blue-light-activated protein [Mariprofundus micogutta]
MLLFSYFDLEDKVSNISSALLDGMLILLLSAFPVYRWVYSPIVQFFKSKQRETDMLAEALQDAGDSVVITNPDGDIIYVNDSFTVVTGYAREEIMGKNPNILSSGKHDKAFYKRMWRSIVNDGFWKGELWNKRKNGELYPEALDIRAVRNDDGLVKFYVGVFSDLTEKKEIESALLQSQKLEAVGTLVGGVAHNFNNLLAAISGKAYLAERSKSVEKTKANLRDIQTLAFDSAELVRQLLTFARETEHDEQHIPIATMLKEAVKTAQIGIPENVTVKLTIPENNGVVFGDPVHLKQAIINIINNARDAVALSDTKEIKIKLQQLNRSNCEYSHKCENCLEEVFQIIIADTGIGISSGEIARIYEPFFTTKEPGKGTGLGLSTALGTIQDHGGKISVDSQFSKGTTFMICLPIDTSEQVDEVETREVIQAVTNSSVLVVDDEEHVRKVTAELLQELGYQVTEAIDGQDALEKYFEANGEFDLIVSDIVMPKMDGADLALKVREHNTLMPMLFITGYDSSSGSADNILENQNTIVLSKPCSPVELSQNVALLLELPDIQSPDIIQPLI